MTEIAAHSLPDPVTHPEFYEDTPIKRLGAWVVDGLVIGAFVLVTLPVTLPMIALTLGAALPMIWLGVSFAYRTVTLARGSATWGMRVMSLEIRRRDGEPLDFATAAAHTALYIGAVVTMPVQLISAGTMLGTARRQGLGDLVLGTAAVNRTE